MFIANEQGCFSDCGTFLPTKEMHSCSPIEASCFHLHEMHPAWPFAREVNHRGSDPREVVKEASCTSGVKWDEHDLYIYSEQLLINHRAVSIVPTTLKLLMHEQCRCSVCAQI